MAVIPRGTDQEERTLMAKTRIPQSTDVGEKGERRSTRHHRVDYDFLGLLHEDYGIDYYSLNKAFMGAPSAPKKQAIALCEWAVVAVGGDEEGAGKALRAWARNRGVGLYDRRLLESHVDDEVYAEAL